MSGAALIRCAELDGERCDVRIAGGRIAAIGRDLPGRAGEASLDARGGALLPGLHDHHLHLLAWAASLASVPCGPPGVRTAAELRAALAAAAPRADGWLRGTGYHESVAGPLDRHALDTLAPGRRVRVQHRSGALWCLSSPAVEALGLDAGADAEGVERDARGRATGRLFDLDAWLRERLPPASPPPLAPVAALLAACGVTGVTDATPTTGPAELARFAELPQRVVAMGPLGLATRGAHKILLRERALPDPDALAERVRAAHAEGRPVAIHCVTRAELVLAACALADAGARAGDRIEHAAVAPPELVALLARLPVTVVTQPNFVRERGDAYLGSVEARDLPWLYRCRGFLDAGVALGGGSDAPFGRPDPWLAMQAAADRRSEAGVALGEREALSPERALGLFTSAPEAPGGPPRRVAPGAPADLCLLDRPWKQARDRLEAACVAATLRAGAILRRGAPE
ncbi:MAG TPA: amidohydrolase family protein [Myxococcota bacterium]|nr:amidohydrolase family protein [Myxococcota bacterium]